MMQIKIWFVLKKDDFYLREIESSGKWSFWGLTPSDKQQ